MTELFKTRQNSSNEELKPCPFCGCNIFIEESTKYPGMFYVHHGIKRCILDDFSPWINGESYEEVAEMWNRRVSE